MGAATSSYAPCPQCSALNMAHRSHCYKCRGPLSGLAGVIGVAQAQATQAQFRPVAMDTRRQSRRQVYIEGAILEGDGIPRQSLAVYDLSEGGLSVHTLLPYPRGTHVRLHIPLEEGLWVVHGTVRHSAPVMNETGRVYACGIEFDEVGPELRELLARILNR